MSLSTAAFCLRRSSRGSFLIVRTARCAVIRGNSENPWLNFQVSTVKQYKLAEKRAAEQRQIIGELDNLVGDIERCVKTINDLQGELAAAVEKHKGPRTTREEIAYLEDLLRCANKKLTWEKHMASLKKRTPAILERMAQLINDPNLPPDDPVRGNMLTALQAVQAAMQKLQDQTAGLNPEESQPAE